MAIPPENVRNPEGFQIFSGGIAMQHWAEMGSPISCHYFLSVPLENIRKPKIQRFLMFPGGIDIINWVNYIAYIFF